MGALNPLESSVSELVSSSNQGLLPSELVNRLSPKASPGEVREAIRTMVQEGLLKYRFDARMVASE
jgi:hypothetical protein